tara:strand:+ start:8826 stop:9782 length:957 start_codon:yes stop_codon:yes gene_type:complete
LDEEKNYISPEERTYFDGAVADFIGRQIGAMSMWDESSEDSSYGTVGRAIKRQLALGVDKADLDKVNRMDVNIILFGEEQLVRELFGMASFDDERNPNRDQAVFSKNNLTGNMVLSGSKLGQSYQKELNQRFTAQLLAEYFNEAPDEPNWGDPIKEYHMPGEDSDYWNEVIQSQVHFDGIEARSRYAIHPDTGEKSFIFRDPLLEVIHVDKDGNFFDYWNVGLDKEENVLFFPDEINKLGLKGNVRLSNVKRAMAAPFTKPPRIYGNLSIDADMVNRKYNTLSQSQMYILEQRFGYVPDASQIAEEILSYHKHRLEGD